MSKSSGRLDPLKHEAGYTKIGDLGTGAFGSVILYIRKLADGQEERVAVKAIARNEYIDYKLVGREVRFLCCKLRSRKLCMSDGRWSNCLAACCGSGSSQPQLQCFDL